VSLGGDPEEPQGLAGIPFFCVRGNRDHGAFAVLQQLNFLNPAKGGRFA